MIPDESEKILIVEGLTDKKQVNKVITEDLTIVCTNGTLGIERFDQLLEDYQLDEKDVYIFVDEDPSGIKLRKQLARELPHAKHLHISSEYREVATTPENILAQVLVSKSIAVNPIFLI
ncbi:toprim domain-containing protein [Cerasibacillus sp. JNUCC 74]|jgi:toprim domain protein|uniref:toprim domain-containing protein n=1 Tax=Virgibacillus proomii TaxID=84407 RepID=UPI000986D6FA|nr:toprim domain-containing protein [Virgibacillus proomii]